jgi:hypothetical protein
MAVIRRLFTELGYKVEDRELKAYTRNTEQAKEQTEAFGDEVVESEKKLKGLARVMDNVRQSAPILGSALKKGALVGAAATVGLIALLREMSQEFDEIAKTAVKFAVGTDELQRLRFAAKLSGAEAEVLNSAIKDFNKFIVEGREAGITPFTTSLDKLGLSINSFAGLSFEQRLGVISDRLQLVANEQERVVLSQRIFGEEAGPQLQVLLGAGSKGIQAMGDDLESLGGVISGETLKAAESFNDQMDRLFIVTKAQVAGALSDLLPLARDLTKQFADWARTNRAFTQGKLEEFVNKFIDTIMTLGKVLAGFLEIWDDLVEAVGSSDTAFIAAAGGITALKLAATGAAGPMGTLAAILIGLLPVALAVGNKLGDIISQDESLRALAGRAERRGAGGLLEQNVALSQTEAGRRVLFGRESINLARRKLRGLVEERESIPAGTGFRQGGALALRARLERQEKEVRDQIAFFEAEERKDFAQFKRERKAAVAEGRVPVGPTQEQSTTFQRFIELQNKPERTAAENAELARLRKQLNVAAPVATGAGGKGPKADKPLTADELVAKSLSPGGGGLSALRGISPGTTIMQIDASITATTNVEVPLDRLPRDATLRETVDMVTSEVARVTAAERDTALAQQRQQIIG